MTHLFALHDRIDAERTDNAVVTVTATGLALVAFVLASLGDAHLVALNEWGARFLLSLSLVDISFTYDDYWPVEYGPVSAAAWTVVVGMVSAGLFLTTFELAGAWFGSAITSIVAFLTTVGVQYGSALLYARLR
jgi:hypothetical protein